MGNHKFFSKDIMPKCKYCRESSAISGGKEYFCIKKGFVEPFDRCSSYKYDPLKRVPDNKVISKNYEKDNFLI